MKILLAALAAVCLGVSAQDAQAIVIEKPDSESARSAYQAFKAAEKKWADERARIKEKYAKQWATDPEFSADFNVIVPKVPARPSTCQGMGCITLTDATTVGPTIGAIDWNQIRTGGIAPELGDDPPDPKPITIIIDGNWDWTEDAKDPRFGECSGSGGRLTLEACRAAYVVDKLTRDSAMGVATLPISKAGARSLRSHVSWDAITGRPEIADSPAEVLNLDPPNGLRNDGKKWFGPSMIHIQ